MTLRDYVKSVKGSQNDEKLLQRKMARCERACNSEPRGNSKKRWGRAEFRGRSKGRVIGGRNSSKKTYRAEKRSRERAATVTRLDGVGGMACRQAIARLRNQDPK